MGEYLPNNNILHSRFIRRLSSSIFLSILLLRWRSSFSSADRQSPMFARVIQVGLTKSDSKWCRNSLSCKSCKGYADNCWSNGQWSLFFDCCFLCLLIINVDRTRTSTTSSVSTEGVGLKETDRIIIEQFCPVWMVKSWKERFDGVAQVPWTRSEYGTSTASNHRNLLASSISAVMFRLPFVLKSLSRTPPPLRKCPSPTLSTTLLSRRTQCSLPPSSLLHSLSRLLSTPLPPRFGITLTRE